MSNNLFQTLAARIKEKDHSDCNTDEKS